MIKPFNMEPDDYYTAMASSQWTQHTRPAVIARDGGKCRICGCETDLQAHHIRYQNDRGENDYFNLKYLVTLCRACHQIVSDAVKKAKDTKIEVPAFMVKPGMYAMNQIEYKIKHSAYIAESELVADTLFKLWKDSLKRKPINMRSLSVMKPIGEIVVNSIEYQAGMTAMGYGVAFAERTINRITQYLAEAYNHYMSEGFTNQWFQREHGLNSAQMIKVRRNADRLIKRGTVSNTQTFNAGVDVSG